MFNVQTFIVHAYAGYYPVAALRVLPVRLSFCSFVP